MSRVRTVLAFAAVLVAFVLAVPVDAASPAPASTPAMRAEHPTTAPPPHVVKATDQILSSAQLTTQAHAARPAAAAAPFLTRPYWNAHSVTSIFDHCNPDYSLDGVICDGNGGVARRSNGVDPSFSAGYAYTPGGRDYVYYDGHNGWDISLNYETLLAAAPGTVQLAGCDPYNGGCNAGFGLTVTIDHGNGFTTRYGHMSQIYVSSGQHVDRGQEIGVSGNTGASTGPHLHFGVYITSSWTAIDPWGWDGAPGADPWPYDVGNLWFTGNPQNPVPWAPTAVTATAQPESAKVSWTAPSFDGGSGVSAYTVTASPGGQTVTVPGSSTSTVVTGLQDGVAYTFTVTASNGIGSSPGSAASNAVTPVGATFGTLPTGSSTTDFQVSWNAPSGGAQSYDLSVSEDGGQPVPWLSGVTATSAHFYGVAGHGYNFNLTVHSGTGAGTVTSQTASIASSAAYPLGFRSAYCLSTTGNVVAINSQPISGGPMWPNWNIARGLAVTPDANAAYVLDGFGGVHPLNGAPSATGYAYWPGWDIARDIALLPDGSGGYVLDGFGGLHPFALGNHAAPPAISTFGYWPNWDIARRLVLTSATGGYVLDGWGGLHPFGVTAASAPPNAAGGPYWPGWDIARGVTLIPGTRSGYVLDGYGGVHPFNGAPGAAISGYWPGQDVARGIFESPRSGSPAGYVGGASGQVVPYGSAPAAGTVGCGADGAADVAAS